jgi:hypothetical protein
VLVVDAHALEPVDLLDLVHQVTARATSPLILRISWGTAAAADEGFAGAT